MQTLMYLEFKKYLANEFDMLAFGAELSKAITKKGVVIFLHGSLGAGKTTLVRGFLRGLGYKDKVKSPTYTLVEEYLIDDYRVFHFDFYRLNHANELSQIGIEEYFSDKSICLIEWADQGLPLLPKPTLNCYINFKGQGREVHLEAYTDLGADIIKQLIA